MTCLSIPQVCECCGSTERLLAHREGQYRLCTKCFAFVYDSEIKTMDELKAAIKETTE